MNKHLFELVRFFVVGLIAVAIDFVVYFWLIHYTPFSTPISKAVSYMCGALFSFIGHRLFVFQATHKRAQKQALPFIVLYVSSLILNNLTNEIVLSISRLNILSWFVATVVAVIWNYLGMKFAVFKKQIITQTT